MANDRRSFARTQDDEKNIHAGHRERLVNRYLRYGARVFTSVQLLEILLFSALPRIDTNIIAHRLINRFGSINAVLNASENELCSVCGIGKKTAHFLIKFGKIIDELKKEPEQVKLNDYSCFMEFVRSFESNKRSAFAVFFNKSASICHIQELECDPYKDWVLPAETATSIIRMRPSFYMLIVNCPKGINNNVVNLIEFYLRYLNRMDVINIDTVLLQNGRVRCFEYSEPLFSSKFLAELIKNSRPYTEEIFLSGELMQRERLFNELVSDNHYYIKKREY